MRQILLRGAVDVKSFHYLCGLIITTMQIYKFNSILKPVLWGGSKLLAFKRQPPRDRSIGESWELSAMSNRESVVAAGDERGLTLNQLVRRYGADLVGREVYSRYGDQFPLLIKFIDAKRDLSVQVHPDDAMAHRRHGCAGKNEMWYIIDTDDGAMIRTGFNRTLTVEEFDRHLADGTLLDVINATESKPGDVFYIPAGQIHTIGAGNMLVEIQQSSDITYRVWDYNRRDADGNLRQLHVEEAREALDFNPRNGQVLDQPCLGEGVTRLVASPEFTVCRIEVTDNYRMELPSNDTFVALVCIGGMATLRAAGMPPVTLERGETALVPAIVDELDVVGTAMLLSVSV